MSKFLRKKKVVKKKPTAIPLPENEEDLSRVLSVFVSSVPDQKAINEGTKIIKEFMKSSHALFPMLMQMSENPDPNIRQIAAVMLYSRIDTYWNDRAIKSSSDQVQQIIADRIEHEEKVNVRNAVTHLAIAITECDMSNKPWLALYEIMLKLVQSENVADVQTGLLLLRYLGHSRAIAEYRDNLFALLFEHIKNDNDIVRSRSLAALHRLFMALKPYDFDEETEKSVLVGFSDKIPELITLLAALVESGDEPSIGHMFNILTLFEETSSLGDHVHPLLEHICHYASQSEISITVRMKATNFIRLVLELRPIVVQNGDHYERLFQLATTLLSEEDDEFGAGSPTESAQGIGVFVLEHSLRVLPRGTILTPLLDMCNNLYHSESSWHRKAAVVAWSVIFEVSPEEITDYDGGKLIPQLVGLLSAKHPQEDVVMQVAFCRFISNFVSYIPEEATMEIDVFMPALLATFESKHDARAQKLLLTRCFSSIDCCAGALGSLIGAYAPQILGYISAFISSEDVFLRSYSMDALASIVEHSSGDVVSSFDELKEILLPSILACDFRAAASAEDEIDEETRRLRNAATQALGALIFPVGAQGAEEVIGACIDNMFDALIFSDDYDDKECSFQFLGQVARTLGTQIPQALNQRIMIACVESIASSEGRKTARHDDDEARGGSFDALLNEDSDEDEEDADAALERKLQQLAGEYKDDDYSGADLEVGDDYDEDLDPEGFASETVDQGALYVKSAAQTAFLRLMEGMGAQMPIDDVKVFVTTILQEMDLPSMGRQDICQTMRAIFSWCHDHYPNPEGVHQGVLTDYHPAVRTILHSCIATVCVTLIHDDEMESAIAFIQVLTLAAEMFGMIAIPGPHVVIGENDDTLATKYMDHFWSTTMIDILEERTNYLIQSENAIEGSSFSERIFIVYFDYLGQVARAQGEHFIPFFDSIANLLVQNVIDVSKGRPGAIRAGGIGAFAEVLDFCGQHALHYLEILPELTLQWLQDDYTECARNAAYLAGCMFVAAGEGASVESFSQLVKGIFQLYERYRSERESDRIQPVGCLDNCVSALIKGMVNCPQIFGDLTHDAVNLVFGEGLPFRSDLIEANAAYKGLLNIYEKVPELVHPHIPNLIKSLTKSCTEVLIENETEQAVGELFGRWAQDVPQLVEQGQGLIDDADIAKAFSNLLQHGNVDGAV